MAGFLFRLETENGAAYLGCDDLDEPAELVFYCPLCAEREFRGRVTWFLCCPARDRLSAGQRCPFLAIRGLGRLKLADQFVRLDFGSDNFREGVIA